MRFSTRPVTPARPLQGRQKTLPPRRRVSPRAKLSVPGDLFSGLSPEQKAANLLSLLCTAVAVRVVLSQLGPGGEGGDLPPTPNYIVLRDFLSEHPLSSGSGDEWLARLTAHNQLLGVRVMEVREAYCREEFSWEQCRQLTAERIAGSNVRLLRQHAAETFGAALAAPPAGEAEGRRGGAADDAVGGES